MVIQTLLYHWEMGQMQSMQDFIDLDGHLHLVGSFLPVAEAMEDGSMSF